MAVVVVVAPAVVVVVMVSHPLHVLSHSSCSLAHKFIETTILQKSNATVLRLFVQRCAVVGMPVAFVVVAFAEAMLLSVLVLLPKPGVVSLFTAVGVPFIKTVALDELLAAIFSVGCFVVTGSAYRVYRKFMHWLR